MLLIDIEGLAVGSEDAAAELVLTRLSECGRPHVGNLVATRDSGAGLVGIRDDRITGRI